MLSLSGSSLLVYWKSNRFPCTNLVSYNFTEFICSNSFLVEALGFSVYSILSCADNDSFLPIGFTPILNSALLWTPKAPGCVFNSGHWCGLPTACQVLNLALKSYSAGGVRNSSSMAPGGLNRAMSLSGLFTNMGIQLPQDCAFPSKHQVNQLPIQKRDGLTSPQSKGGNGGGKPGTMLKLPISSLTDSSHKPCAVPHLQMRKLRHWEVKEPCLFQSLAPESILLLWYRYQNNNSASWAVWNESEFHHK